jgi:hypothetical protein
MVQRYVSDAKEVDIEVPAGLVVGETTVAEVDGRLEKSYARLVPKPRMKHSVLTGSLKITGKVKPG